MIKFKSIILLVAIGSLLIGFGCSDDDDNPPAMISEWSAVLIEGALDPQGNLHEQVDGTWSKIVLRNNGTYTWFLDAPPWFDLSGEGSYTAVPDSGFIRISSGPILAYLGVSKFDIPENETLTFVDDDSDRWIYELTMMAMPD